MNVLRFLISQVLLLAGASMIYGQTAGGPPQPPAASVTISPSAEGVRFVALGGVKAIRLEVLGADGETVYNSGFARGNLRDWKLEDNQGHRLADGSYLCVVTVRDLAGQLGVRQGSVLIQGGKASLQLVEGAQAGPLQVEKGLAAVAQSEGTPEAVTLTAHDGRDGQLVSTHGALTFRTGDLFAGRDRERMRLTEDGRLGVGTSTPEDALDVAGTIRAQGGIRFADGTVLTSASQSKSPAALLTAAAAGGGATTAMASGAGTVNRLARWLDGSGTLGDSSVSDVGGLIGIGTASPTQRLDVVGNGKYFGPAGSWVMGTAHHVFISDDGSPVGFQNTRPDAGSGAQMFDHTGAMRAFFQWHNVNAPNGNSLNFATALNDGITFTTNTYDARMTITGPGNVGIGTTTPQSKLEVAGNLKVTGNAVIDGNIAAKYQDVAEWVPASGELAAGTVVTLDVRRSNAVTASRRAYDTRVAGVVSARPGVVLGEGGEGKVLVATTGRVRVKADATRRPIRVGDILVTSGRAGAAMRSVPVRAGRAHMHRPGTIIGKALEPLGGGVGEILVLLSMQ
jgi:hypothetical protein